jgi:hypothetical protein
MIFYSVSTAIVQHCTAMMQCAVTMRHLQLHLWQHTKSQLCKYETLATGVWEIWDRVAEVWNDIEPEVCQRLIESMPRRLEAVIKAKGGHTKY